MLADKLDPTKRDALELRKKKWVEPPDIVEWAHSSFIDPVAEDFIELQDHQARILRTILRMIWDKKVTTMVYSDIKKSGKTTIAGLVGAYWASFVEQPNEIITIANDKEQAQGRIYDAMKPTMSHMNWYVPEKAPQMENKKSGSKIKAISTNYAGEAGGNYGLTLWSELWAFTSEARKRLWEEMTPIPTRRYSVRWVETYAGFLGESDLLWNLYSQAFRDGDEAKPLGSKIAGLEDLPIYYMPDSKLVVYWNHTPRMPWQTPDYYSQQRADLRPNAYARLHQNTWVSSTDIFISPADWDALEACEPLNPEGDKRPLFLGADGSTSGDSTALVAATWDSTNNRPEIVRCWVWTPKKQEGSINDKKIIDLSDTLKTQIAELLDKYDVVAVYYDMYQLHAIMTDLQKIYDRSGVKQMFVNFPQTTGRIESDQALYQFITTKKLRRVKDVILREHVLDAVAEESVRGYRITKEKTSRKIDACVAASMACYGASVRNRPMRKFIKV